MLSRNIIICIKKSIIAMGSSSSQSNNSTNNQSIQNKDKPSSEFLVKLA